MYNRFKLKLNDSLNENEIGVIKNSRHHDKVILESLLSFKRAGANAIITYFAKDIAKRLK